MCQVWMQFQEHEHLFVVWECQGMSTCRLRFISTWASRPPFTKAGQWPSQLGEHPLVTDERIQWSGESFQKPCVRMCNELERMKKAHTKHGRHPRWSRTEAMRKGTSTLWRCVSLSFNSLTAIYCWTHLLKSNKNAFSEFLKKCMSPHPQLCARPCFSYSAYEVTVAGTEERPPGHRNGAGKRRVHPEKSSPTNPHRFHWRQRGQINQLELNFHVTIFWGSV